MDADTRREDKKERKRRAREALLLLFRRVREVCDAVGQVDGIADQVEDLVNEVVNFAKSTEIRELVPERRRLELSEAAEAFRNVKDRIDAVDDACSRLQKAMSAVDKVLASGLSAAVIAGAVAVIAVAGIAIAVATAVVLDGDGPNDPPRITETAVAGQDRDNGDVATDPRDVFSPSHEVGVPSGDPVITVGWSLHEGALAFSIDWTPGALDVPNTQPGLSGDAVEATSPSLPDDEWYFHLRTQGRNGEWTSTVHLGPFVIDRSGQCPAFDGLALNAEPPELGSGDILVSWEASGGCPPFTGRLTATESADNAPYAGYGVTEPSGELVDEVIPPCQDEDSLDIVYELTLMDGEGQVLEATTSAEVAGRVC